MNMQIYGILAHPAKHSLSPKLHNAAFKALNIDAHYDKFDVTPEELEDFILGVRDEDIKGLSVSLPHKEAVIEYVDELSEDARAMGAVNTIKNVDGVLLGENVDFFGTVEALEDVTKLANKKCLVFGAGGAGRAVVYGLKKCGAEVLVLNRTLEKAKKLAEQFDCEYGGLENSVNFDADIIIQTTSCWLSDIDTKLLPDGYLKPEMIVMDIVYSPLFTPLLKDAEKAGCKIITGDKMLLYQAFEQFKIWTGKEAPRERMEQVLKNSLGK